MTGARRHRRSTCPVLNRDRRCLAAGPWPIRLAARLARDGDPEPIHIEENDTTFAIGWKGRYRIEGPAFIYVDYDTGQLSTILGYPTHLLK